MSNELTLAVNKNQGMSVWESSDDLKQIKEIYGKNLSAGEFNTLVQMGKATGLNPFLREIWAVKYGTEPAQIFIGRDGYRKSAQSNDEYDYHYADAVYSNDEFSVIDGEVSHSYKLMNRGELVGAYGVVKRKSASRSSYVFVELREYSTGKSLWRDTKDKGKPATMIKKVAEAQALKASFQELFGNSYHEYEQFDREESAPHKKTGTGVNGLKEKLGIKNHEVIETEYEDISVDSETGEIQETHGSDEQADGSPSFDQVKSMLLNATSVETLISAYDIVRSMKLPAPQTIELNKLFKQRQVEVK